MIRWWWDKGETVPHESPLSQPVVQALFVRYTMYVHVLLFVGKESMEQNRLLVALRCEPRAGIRFRVPLVGAVASLSVSSWIHACYTPHKERLVFVVLKNDPTSRTSSTRSADTLVVPSSRTLVFPAPNTRSFARSTRRTGW